MSYVHSLIGSGGIKGAFAVILVTYPSGSTCTCTKGSKVLTASDTSGSYIFVVPESGTWTLSCTDGSRTASNEVTIREQYQAESTVLLYELYLYDTGNEYTSVTGGFSSYAYLPKGISGWNPHTMNVSKTSTEIKLTGTEWGESIFAAKNPIDITPFTTLSFNFPYLKQPSSDNVTWEIMTFNELATGYTQLAANVFQSEVFTGSKGLVTLDVSGVNQNAYVGIRMKFNGGNLGGYEIDVDKIWLE